MGKEKKITQCDRILKYIHDFGFITSWQAYQDLGITQLGARLRNLEDNGYSFSTKTVQTKNRYGDNTHYTEYRLAGEPS